MPFTLAHPALILPFKYFNKRRWFSLTGLVVGSMIPDFEAFIRLSARKNHGHSWIGALWFDLPMALIVIFLFHNIVRDDLLENLPGFFKRRFYFCKGFNWNKYFLKHPIQVISSILIGITTHLLWDILAHGHTPLPLDTIYEMAGQALPPVVLLQLINSLVGCILIAIAIIRLPAQPVPFAWSIYFYWFVACSVAIVCTAVKASMYTMHTLSTDVFLNILMGNCFLGLLVVSLLFKIKIQRFIL